MKRTTNIRIESFDLSQEQHDMAIEMVMNDKHERGNYSLDETDKEIANVWISEAHADGNTDYAEFLRKAIAENAELYTLTDHLGGFSQQIGEVAVFYN